MEKRERKPEAADVGTLTDRIVRIMNHVDPDFWVPAVANGQIGSFVEFVLSNNLGAVNYEIPR